MTGKKQHRTVSALRCGECGDRIRMALAASHQSNADFTSQACVGIGHMHSGGFVAHVDDADRTSKQRIIDRHDVIARKRKDMSYAASNEGIDEGFSAA